MTVLAIGPMLSNPVAALAQANLYAGKVPAGSSYVRIVDGDSKPLKVGIGAAAPVALSPEGTIATSYHLEPGGTNLTLTLNGAAHSLAVPKNKYLTVVYRAGALTTIEDSLSSDIGLRAQLAFYNLVQNCVGSLSIENGPGVFTNVAPFQSNSRTINPVAATLIPKCGTSAGPGFKLPLLKAQSRYSIFLVGDGSSPNAVGNEDATDSGT